MAPRKATAAKAPARQAATRAVDTGTAQPVRPASANRQAARIDGNRSALLGGRPTITSFHQAASDHPQLPRIPQPTPQTLTSANARLRAMSRYLRANDPWIRGVVDRMCDRVVGDGPEPDFGDADLNRLWAESCDEFDARGTEGWGQLVRDGLYRTYCVDGESFARLQTPKPTGYDEDGFPVYDDGLVPLRILTMTAEWVPDWQTGFEGTIGGVSAYAVQGVCLDKDDLNRRIGYVCYQQHPFDIGIAALNGLTAEVVPAAECVHLMTPGMIGAYRGDNRMAPVMIRAMRLSDYEDSEARRKQLDNALCFFLYEDATSAGEGMFPGEYAAATGQPVDVPPADGSAPPSGYAGGEVDMESLKSQVDISPGGVTKLPQGMKMQVNNPKPTPQTDNWWINHQLLAFGACFGLPGYEVSPNFADLSDRTLKFATTILRTTCSRERKTTEKKALNPIARGFVNAAIISGRWSPKAGKRATDYYRPSWRWPLIQDAQLAQDIGAYIEAVEAKLIPRDYVTQSLFGLDPAEVAHSLASIAARDGLYGLRDAPVAAEPPGSTVIVGWDDDTPMAQQVLAEQAALLGVAPTLPDRIPPPANPLPPAPAPAPGKPGDAPPEKKPTPKPTRAR